MPKENFLKQISKVYPEYLFYKRFILPEGGFSGKDDRLDVLEEEEMLHLPFPRIFLEYTDYYSDLLPDKKILTNVAIAVSDSDSIVKCPEGSIKINAFLKIPEENCNWAPFPDLYLDKRNWFALKKDKDGYFFNCKLHEMWFKLMKIEESAAAPYIYSTLGLLNILCCHNISLEKETPKAKHKGKGRIKPYDSYWVLHVDNISNKKNIIKNSNSEFRASPREHARRGHARRQHYKDGVKKIWIQPTLVNPGIGHSVVKDYEISK